MKDAVSQPARHRRRPAAPSTTGCASSLWNLGSQRNRTVMSCLCTADCPWVWQRRPLTLWSPLAFWRTTAPEIGGDLWVRLSAEASRAHRIAEERG